MQEDIVSNNKRKIPLGWYWRVEYVPGELGRSLGHSYALDTYHNALLDEGERNVLDVYFRGNLLPPTFYLGLHSGTIGETQGLANVSEPSQAGYARLEITRSLASWSAPTLNAGDMQTTGPTKSFNAAATWTPVSEIFLASTSGGALGSVILSASLSTLRSLVSGDQLNCTVTIKAQ